MTPENLNKGNSNFEYAFLPTCNPNKDANIHNDYRTKTFQSIYYKIYKWIFIACSYKSTLVFL